jgi:hypothetical protein
MDDRLPVDLLRAMLQKLPLRLPLTDCDVLKVAVVASDRPCRSCPVDLPFPCLTEIAAHRHDKSIVEHLILQYDHLHL